MYYYPIVEGYGEVDAVSILLRRISSEIGGTFADVPPPHRVKSSAFLQFGNEFYRSIQLGAEKAKVNNGIVVILLDCEDDCPATLGPKILAEAKRLRSDVNFEVFLAYREFETWFIWAAESLAGEFGWPQSLVLLDNPESLRDAKGWIGKHLPQGYKETTHQKIFTAKFDLIAAQQSDSFQRLVNCIKRYK